MTDDRAAMPRERRYAIVPKETVQLCADSVGLAAMSDEMSTLLAEDVSYRLRDIIQQSYECMRHAKRRKLTSDDINRAMKNSDIQPVYGQSISESGVGFQQTKEGDIYFPDDAEVNLLSVVANDVTAARLGATTVKAEWLAIEGVPTVSSLPLPESQGKVSVGRTVQSLSEDLLLYYDMVTKAILDTDSTIMKHALVNLTTSCKVAPLLAYFINFVSNGVKTVSHDTSQLSRLLYTIKALVSNKTLFLEPKPYLTLLTQTILYCQLEPLAASINSLTDHWVLRDYAAILLATTIARWDNPTNKLRQQNKKILGDVLADNERPLCAHYGAIMGLLALGLDAVKDTLLPVLSTRWSHWSTFLDGSPNINATRHADAVNVIGALLLCADYLIRSERCHLLNIQCTYDSSLSVDDSSHSPTQLYASLYEYFGDSLSMRLPIIRGCFQSISPRDTARLPSTTNILGSEDSASTQTGEQLLQQFLDPGVPHNARSVLSSDRSSPLSSEYGGGVPGEDDASDMAIKETVSDPSRGIRLTILKRPKQQLQRAVDDLPPPPSGSKKSTLEAGSKSGVADSEQHRDVEMPALKMMRTSSQSTSRVKWNMNEVFEDKVVATTSRTGRLSSVVFVFRFQGRIQECVAPTGPRPLPRWGVGGHATISWYQVLCRRSRFIARRAHVRTTRCIKTETGDTQTHCIQQSHGARLTCGLDLAWTVL